MVNDLAIHRVGIGKGDAVGVHCHVDFVVISRKGGQVSLLGRLARQGGVNGLIDLLDGAFRHLGHAQCLFRILLQQPGDLLLGQRVRGK